MSLADITRRLCSPESLARVHHRFGGERSMPSVAVLADIVARLKGIVFPGYFGGLQDLPETRPETLAFHVGAELDNVFRLLAEQIRRGHCFFCQQDAGGACQECETLARQRATDFLTALPDIRARLALDVQAAYEGDPAARSPGEAIFCYPSILALTHHRIAHALHGLGVKLIPRIIAEMAHSATGIDIHPGATIGASFFIDHGTGVVIGETSVIGSGVRLYQGVTLGAKSFPKDEEGRLVKGLARHPIVEDDVTIYAGATILGRVTIGRGAVVGGNVWLTEDVPAGARVLQESAAVAVRIENGAA